ncbi:hypothetical protein A0J61_10178 [Choanephora cucurbitarum]|uniref:Transposase Tc1-like domain-containing protein n=1 Tax=Choanephora cucurbitarum TaxID=101091 RepID=A0A1C7MY81_9FUNG|nr:hypothetical protein A0J61_10178 [Choanephora cucurbitarum]
MNNTENKCKRSLTRCVGGVYWLNKEGCNNITIGKKVWLARETVRDIVKTVEKTNTPLHRKPIARPKKINSRSSRQLKRAVVRNSFMSIQDIIVFYPRNLEFKLYYAAYKPALTDTHKRNRLEWAKEHLH